MPAVLILFLALACNKDGGEECTDVFHADEDGDGHGDPNNTTTACDVPDGFTTSDDDCDDANPATFPGADEICDGLDNDCETSTILDENAVDERNWFQDVDGDGFGSGDATVGCDKPGADWVGRPNDCDDANPELNPDADEVCNDIDDNCDDLIDEADPALADGETWFTDSDGDSWGVSGTEFVSCDDDPKDASRRGDDCDDTTVAANPERVEICDGIDNDCDTLIDTDDDSLMDQLTFWVDADGDGYGDPKGATVVGCEAPTGYAADNTDCDDNDAEWHAWLDYYRDLDGDGYGAGDPHNKCKPTVAGKYIEVANDWDCNDTDANVSPDAPAELCAEGDENCNELEAEADPALVPDVWYIDTDGDGFGVATKTIGSCDPQAGYSLTDGDCNDADNYVYPGAPEICDLIDNDCDAMVEDDTSVDWYADLDSDGYGDPADTVNDCYEPSSYVMDDTDCDDAVSTTHPDAAEICANGVDDNCDTVNDNCIFDIGDAGFVFLGETEGQQLGLSVATGDFDGDGSADDILMGSEWAERDDGEVYIVTGPASVSELSAADAITLSRPGGVARTYFGAGIGAGDADGDGVDDVLVNPFLPEMPTIAEQSFLFLGPTTADRDDPDLEIEVRTPVDLEIVSDFDGDDVNDLVIAADNVYVIDGAQTGTIVAVLDATYSWTGGMSPTKPPMPIPVMDVEDMGDVDGDGFNDLAMGSTQATEGQIWIVPGGLSSGSYVAQSEAMATIESSGEFASCMTSGDYDGDGKVDLITNAPQVKTVSNDHYGAVYAFLAPTLDGPLTETDADTTWESAGGAGKQMAVGDFDGDDSLDIAMGNAYGEYAQGFVFVQFGYTEGTVDDALLLSIPGRSNEWHGTSLGAVGDWTGDGADELVIGAQALGAEGIWGAGSTGGAYVVFSEELYPAL